MEKLGEVRRRKICNVEAKLFTFTGRLDYRILHQAQCRNVCAEGCTSALKGVHTDQDVILIRSGWSTFRVGLKPKSVMVPIQVCNVLTDQGVILIRSVFEWPRSQ